MDEEIKDTNCIVKAFENNPISILQEEVDNKKIFWFRASDIGKVLGLSNINVSIQNYDDHERGLRKAYTPEGGTQQALFLTSQGVYRLLYNSKKDIAKKFRKWAGGILDDIIFNESNQLKEQIERKNRLLIEKESELEVTKKQLEKEKKDKNLLLNRRYQSERPGEGVYLYKDGENRKIGRSSDISEREKIYSNMSKTGEIVYFQRCLNSKLTEKLLHHMLDKYRIIRNSEWFSISDELAIQAIKSMIFIIDAQMTSIDDFIPKLYNSLNFDEINQETNNKTRNSDPDTDSTSDSEYNKPEIVNQPRIDPYDFDRFIRECCEISEEYRTPRTNIKDAHRIWSKNNTKDVVSKLDIYLSNKFKTITVFDESDIRRNMLKCIKLKPFIFKTSCENLDYEQFIVDQVNCENMKIDWKCRISYNDFFNYFIEWKKIKEPEYKLQYAYKRHIQKYLEDTFAAGRVHISGGTETNHLHGIWGLGHKITNFGLKNPDRTNKIVCQYNINNELIKKWDSLSIASRELNIKLSTLSNYARFQNVINDIYYKYE